MPIVAYRQVGMLVYLIAPIDVGIAFHVGRGHATIPAVGEGFRVVRAENRHVEDKQDLTGQGRSSKVRNR